MKNVNSSSDGLPQDDSPSKMCDAMIYVCFESDFPGHKAEQDGAREAVNKAVGSVHDTPNWLNDPA